MIDVNLLRMCAHVTGRTIHRLRTVVSGIAFWTGIVIPLSYLLFIIPGVRTRDQFTLFLVLVAINYLALILGYPYHNRPDT